MLHNGARCPPAGKRGAFILFEGVDRCGKTTQSQRLVESLQKRGVEAELWRFPDRTTAIGQMIDSYLTSKADIDDAAVHLLFSANRWEMRDLLLSKLRDGTTLVIDRYAFSGAAFTAAKGLPGMDLDWAKAPDRGLPAPDVVLYLSLSAEAAAQRGGYGGERYEKDAMQREVRRQFELLQENVEGWRVLDAAQTIEDLQKQVQEIAAEVIQRCEQGGQELRHL